MELEIYFEKTSIYTKFIVFSTRLERLDISFRFRIYNYILLGSFILHISSTNSKAIHNDK